jgi:hypothetical protein
MVEFCEAKDSKACRRENRASFSLNDQLSTINDFAVAPDASQAKTP